MRGVNLQGTPQLVKVGALCVKKEGVQFLTHLLVILFTTS